MISSMSRNRHRCVPFLAALAVALFWCSNIALAGGGPENVMLVVNNSSDSSKLIANHYISLRSIPDRNVIYLNSIPFKEAIPLLEFERKILRPVLAAIEDRGLGGSIDYIVYSSDFPTTVRIGSIQKQFAARAAQEGVAIKKEHFAGEASISSMTYLGGLVLHAPWQTMSLTANRYYRIPTTQMLQRPFVGSTQKEFERSIAAISRSVDDPLYESAITSLRRLATENPGQTAVLYWLAKLYAKKGDESEADRWMKFAIGMGWSDQRGTAIDPHFSTIRDRTFQARVRGMSNYGRQDIASRGFRQLYQWAPNGMLNQTVGQGDRYFLSTVLAVTRNDGNTEAEAVRQLTRSVAADFTRPAGTFYFTLTDDVRTTTRRPKFKQAANELQDLGFRAEIVKTRLPQKKNDILGLTSGTPQFAVAKSESSIVPGAICENLTSFGGRLGAIGGQTKLTEFLRYGAAGSSGAVVEPFTFPHKFPSPMIHVHYARGCSLAESFYQSIFSPFQMLIVGDALCQPFAKPPQVLVEGVGLMEKVSGIRKISFNKANSPVRVAGMELFVDGVLRRRDKSLEPIEFDTSFLSDGYHEVRTVFIAANQIETTSRSILQFVVDNNGQSCSLTSDKPVCGFEDLISVTFAAEGASKIRLCQHEKVLHSVDSAGGFFTVPAKEIGRGKTTLRAIATIGDAEVSSVPLQIQVNGPLSETKEFTSKAKNREANNK